jgi:DNA repair protein RecO (recombination protein O)
MRHKYETRGMVLSRTPLGEANASISLLTADVGLVRVRVQGVRQSGAKLAAALATFTESNCVLVRGREGWRLAGAVLEENWFARMSAITSRQRAARVSGLLLRLVADEVQDPKMFSIMKGFFLALATLPDREHEAAEVLAALRVLAALGLDAGTIPGDMSAFDSPVLASVSAERNNYIARINQGIAVSGL